MVRNGVKRRLREIFRDELPEIQAERDFVISARAAASGATYQELEEEFGKAMRKLGDRA